MSLREYIWNRQYALHEGESYAEGLRRVAEVVANAELKYAEAGLPAMDVPEASQRFYNMMADGRFIPGGRILAGAGTKHGNVLNCFVQDGSPYKPGSFAWTMHLAKKLALVTKVGGGNGLNLDPYAPYKPHQNKVGRLYLTIDPDHPDYDDVRLGRVRDPYTGQKVERGYRYAQFGHGALQLIAVDDSIEGIFDAATEATRLLLEGVDVTVDLSRLRPEGLPVKGSGGTSSGPASFAVEIFDNFARWAKLGGAKYAGPVATLRYVFASTLRVIRQGGTRRGAGMATLSIDHPDWQDFLTAKDLDREAAEGDISTFNISFLVSEAFMQNAHRKGTEEYERLRQVAVHAHATGEPGLLFVDTINAYNPLVALDGPIVATNPCGEITLYPGEPCDLGAINLDYFARHGEEELEQTVFDAVHFLDNVLDVENPPLEEIGRAIQDKRRIGLGLMGLADYLIRKGLRYDSEEGRQAAHDLTRQICAAAVGASRRLGVERGVPEGVERAMLSRRNVAVLTVAPTGTTSMLMGVSSGIEPVFAAVYQRRVGTEVKDVVHPLLLEMLEEERALDWLHCEEVNTPLLTWNENRRRWEWDLDLLVQAINKAHGSVQPLVERGWLPPWFDVFLTAHDIDPESHVRMQAEIQRAFDQWPDGTPTFAGNSISKTINLPHDAGVEDVLSAYSLAWKEGCKGITVYRDGSRGYQVLSAGEGDFEAWAEELERGDEVVEFDDGTVVDFSSRTVYPSTRPAPSLRARESVIDSRTHKYAVGGRKVYVTVGWNREGEVVECFITLSKPTPNEAVAVDIVGRLVSLAFKYSASVDDVTKHLEGHFDQSGGLAEGLGFVNSVWDVVAATLRQYRCGAAAPQREEAVGAQPKGNCPECGQGALVRKGGCNKCERCGYEACG